MYAVMFYIQAPDDNENVKLGVPKHLVWRAVKITSAEVNLYKALEWTIYSDQEYEDYIDSCDEDLRIWFENKYGNDSRLRVLDLVHDDFKAFHPSKIDFARHLKPNIALNKRITMLKNGRPDTAIYSFNGSDIAKIRFHFEVDSNNFMTKRAEYLSYAKNNGEWGDEYLIKKKVFDVVHNLNDFMEVIEERVAGRYNVIKDIKSVFLMQASDQDTFAFVDAMQAWHELRFEIDSWINSGAPDLINKIQTSESDFMSMIVTADNSGLETDMTFKDYLLNRLTY